MSTEKRFIQSTAAAYGSQMTRMVVRLVADVVLARLILDEDHGLFALALVIVELLGFVRDLGLPYQVIRDPRRPYGAVLAWELIAGPVVTIGLFVAAPLAAGLDPALPGVLRGLALYILLDGLALVPRLLFESELEVHKAVVPEILRSLTFAAVACGLAQMGAGVWSFVAGELVSLVVLAGLLWYRAWGRLSWSPDPATIADLLRKSSYLFLIALIANSVPRIAPFIVLHYENSAVVGQFKQAFGWAMRLQLLIVPTLVRVLYPTLIAYRGQQAKFVGAYRLCTASIMSCEILTTYWFFFNAQTFMVSILGPQWEPAVPLLRILCLVPLAEPFTRLGGEILKSRNEDRIWLIGVLLNVVCLVTIGAALTRAHGVAGMAVAHFLLLGNWLIAWRLWRIFGRDFIALVRDLAVVYVLPAPLFGIAAWTYADGTWARLIATSVAAIVAAALLAWRLVPPLKEFFRPDPAAASASSAESTGPHPDAS